MAGLARIAKMYGSIVINDERFVWDYVLDYRKQEWREEFRREYLAAQSDKGSGDGT